MANAVLAAHGEDPLNKQIQKEVPPKVFFILEGAKGKETLGPTPRVSALSWCVQARNGYENADVDVLSTFVWVHIFLDWINT